MRFSAALTCEGGGPLEGQFVVVEDAATARSVASLRGRALAARRSAADARSVADRVPVTIDDDEEEETSCCGRPSSSRSRRTPRRRLVKVRYKLYHRRAVADVIKCDVGAVTPSDVELASTFGAPIFAFNVGASGSVREACRRREVPYTRHDIVYSLVDDVASYLSSKLPPDRISKDVARAEVLQLFTLNNGTTVIGCRIVEGTFPASAGVRVARSSEVIATDARGVASLRRVKDRELKSRRSSAASACTHRKWRDW